MGVATRRSNGEGEEWGRCGYSAILGSGLRRIRPCIRCCGSDYVGDLTVKVKRGVGAGSRRF